METENTFTIGSAQSIRQTNAYFVERNFECTQIINELREIENLLEDFETLTFGRDFVTRPFDQDIPPFSPSDITKWINNNLAHFQISQVLKTIATDPRLKSTVEKYHLKESFKKISDHLNNYVHGNGRAYYNRSVASYTQIELTGELSSLAHNARYMTMVFLLLLVLCSSLLVMAEDYIDYLDMNTTPPENSQYRVAPFIETFVKENISLIDENCLDYLRDNTMMEF